MIWEKHYMTKIADAIRAQEHSYDLIQGTKLATRISNLAPNKRYWSFNSDTRAYSETEVPVSQLQRALKNFPIFKPENYVYAPSFYSCIAAKSGRHNIKIENKTFPNLISAEKCFANFRINEGIFRNINLPSLTSGERIFYCSNYLNPKGKSLLFENVNAPLCTTLADTFFRVDVESITFKNCNFPAVKNFSSTFEGTSTTTGKDSSVVNLDLSGLQGDSVNYIAYIFNGAKKLTNLIFFYNLGKGYTDQTANKFAYQLKLSETTVITHDSIMDVINKLYDLNLTYNVAGGGTLYSQTLYLGTTNLNKLTAEEKAIATVKGWTLS